MGEITRTYNFLQSSIKTLKNVENETCPICLDDIIDTTITKCGHKFCWDCISKTKKAQNSFLLKCPNCNTLMNNKEIYLLENKCSEQETEQSDIKELQELVQKTRSTKIGNIIHYLKTKIEKDDKIIIFSQWDTLLHRVGDLITEQNLNVVYCTGSVYQRKKSIISFQEDPNINIFMLSVDNCASGINLTIANKIIFLEPVYGDNDYRKSIEEQAVGRNDRIGQKRPIEIHRFIIKDTIEQEILDENATF